ncbi:MAG: hypothetical protein AB7H88_00100 [Vicinamibacterales bacterium]
MSPILTRPVREQFEHDRVIRLLEGRYRRKHEVAINPGGEQNQSVMSGELAVYPDLVLFGAEKTTRLEGTVEVETGESVNYLEALAEWGPFGRLHVPFYLYVPPQALESARRLCAEHHIPVAEIWTYHLAFDQVRFTMVHRDEAAAKMRPAPKAAARTVAARPPAAPKAPAVSAAKLAKLAKASKAARAAKAAAPKPAKAAKPVKPAKVAKVAKAAKVVKTARPAKATKAAKAAKPARTAKAPAAKKPARAAAARPARTAKSAKTAKAAAKAKPARGARRR